MGYCIKGGAVAVGSNSIMRMRSHDGVYNRRMIEQRKRCGGKGGQDKTKLSGADLGPNRNVGVFPWILFEDHNDKEGS